MDVGLQRCAMPNPIKILLVEDNEDDEHLTMRSLRKWDREVEFEVVRDGQEALDRLMNDALPSPFVVLLDINLPKIGGISVLNQVRANPLTAELPVIVLVSSDEPSKMRAGYETCASWSLQKPLSIESFVLAIKSMGLHLPD